MIDRRALPFCFFVLTATPAALPCHAQAAYGLGPQILYVGPQEFQPNSADSGRLVYGGNFVYSSSAPGISYDAPLRLPAGAQIDLLRCYFYSDGDATRPTASIVTRDFDTISKIGSGSSALATSTSPEAIGYHEPEGTATANPASLVRYRPSDDISRFYVLQLSLTDTGDRTRGCEVEWHRTVSDPPVAPTYLDLPVDEEQKQAIEALAAAGITSGCGGGNYCPDSPLTRAQLALFLARALGLHWQD